LSEHRRPWVGKGPSGAAPVRAKRKKKKTAGADGKRRDIQQHNGWEPALFKKKKMGSFSCPARVNAAWRGPKEERTPNVAAKGKTALTLFVIPRGKTPGLNGLQKRREEPAFSQGKKKRKGGEPAGWEEKSIVLVRKKRKERSPSLTCQRAGGVTWPKEKKKVPNQKKI